ncbi:MAG TPA: decarboxylating NADP(+)-dependent phosphogluconate dehydrogenase [Rectinema sp.]|jgi:6-phosphogluconate dehydrogenase|nr:decarboxylating NADP(+)-dependent phosphogluconate dehydrogenase [Spirochaetia bacterium]NLH88799.1 decarboxylating NADP(+)-dependent phosphogluconate dehydrogenase [Treponema sp.]OQC74797.1 MAG: 6-phosphogluconate dehydrogenase, NADP(+)-dependent, decarboxylating [Spirochaetes bacterium ADurb.Bin001]HNP93124.1 decarboxylating NADP(+)-dependent phosphogluconate dehydrogenase [Rectinema sp.]HNT59608.1 decarboxylating NADP(+)-dependent phosphogluconate dehydrogenase [Rectinema sp.]
MKADIGLIGLAVMGENLVLNMESHEFTVAVYNRTVEKVDSFLKERGAGKRILGAHSPKELVEMLKKPRIVMLMIRAGTAVDEMIAQLIPFLEPGDIIVDGGNSNYEDTMRRFSELESKGFLFVGTGISGGEEGALTGPSIMPGGSEAAWPHVKPIFQAIAAKVDNQSPCCEWVGPSGSGHFVKMVHNGIEYGDMQLISEVYQIMRDRLSMSPDEMAMVFDEWNKGELDSYLTSITSDILRYKDEDGTPLIEKILDAAGQKGTGKWAGINALNFAVPLTLIVEAVFARCISAMKDERLRAVKVLGRPTGTEYSGSHEKALKDLGAALYAAKIISYAQGFMLMREASTVYDWKLNYGSIALMWRGGCIIRSRFLGRIKEAFDVDPGLSNLVFAPFFAERLLKNEKAIRNVVTEAVAGGIPVPALSSALAWFDALRTERLPANLIQAQRDYFGAHTYERIDKPRGQFFHTNWTGHGGSTSASTYIV